MEARQECTCAHVDYGINPRTGKPSLKCTDDIAQGRSKTFSCGATNHRGRAGHDEFRSGMRNRNDGPCLCSTTPGKTVNDACFQFKTEALGEEFDYAPRCLPVVHVNEDEWSYISGKCSEKSAPLSPTLLIRFTVRFPLSLPQSADASEIRDGSLGAPRHQRRRPYPLHLAAGRISRCGQRSDDEAYHRRRVG